VSAVAAAWATTLKPVRLVRPGEPVRIAYRVGVADPRLDLAVYDARGRLVRTLVHGRATPGRFVTTWDRRDGAGAAVARGIYFARLAASGTVTSCKMVLAQR
jgi:hypothetical protein